MSLITNPHISDNFTWDEVTNSYTAERLGIDNAIPDIFIPAAKQMARQMEIIRAILGKPIIINSWYRCSILNCAIKGSPTSDHLSAEAVDFICPQFGSPVQIAKALSYAYSSLTFKQLILEHTWIHVSYDTNPAVIRQRNEVLSLLSNGKYARGLTDKNGVPV